MDVQRLGSAAVDAQVDENDPCAGKCLAVAGGNTNSGTRSVWITGGGAQSSVRSNWALINPVSGLCLHATGGDTAAGTPLQNLGLQRNRAQQWTLPVGSDVLTTNGADEAVNLVNTDRGAKSSEDRVPSDPARSGYWSRLHQRRRATNCTGSGAVEILVERICERHSGWGFWLRRRNSIGVATARATCVAGLRVLYVRTLVTFPPYSYGLPVISEWLLHSDPGQG